MRDTILSNTDLISMALEGEFSEGPVRFIMDDGFKRRVVEVFDSGEALMAVEIYHGQRLGGSCFVDSYPINTKWELAADDASTELLGADTKLAVSTVVPREFTTGLFNVREFGVWVQEAIESMQGGLSLKDGEPFTCSLMATDALLEQMRDVTPQLGVTGMLVDCYPDGKARLTGLPVFVVPAEGANSYLLMQRGANTEGNPAILKVQIIATAVGGGDLLVGAFNPAGSLVCQHVSESGDSIEADMLTHQHELDQQFPEGWLLNFDSLGEEPDETVAKLHTAASSIVASFDAGFTINQDVPVVAMDLQQQVVANQNRRDACPRHFFDYDEILPLGMALECSVCGAGMDHNYVGAYIQGYEASGGDYRDIYPNYKKLYQLEGVHEGPVE